jgi:hypothetical protein
MYHPLMTVQIEALVELEEENHCSGEKPGLSTFSTTNSICITLGRSLHREKPATNYFKLWHSPKGGVKE